MKLSKKYLWILDSILFVGFLVSYLFDLTGLTWHEWLGAAVGVIAGIHLILHWNWVEAVALRFFKRPSGQARGYFLLDAAIGLGFYLILASGLVISSWLDFALGSAYLTWLEVHIVVSIATLLLVVLKIALHWRWIVFPLRQPITPPAAPSPATTLGRLHPVPAALVPATQSVSRAEFLKLMGVVGIAAAISLGSALNAVKNTQAKGTNYRASTAQDPNNALSDTLASESPLVNGEGHLRTRKQGKARLPANSDSVNDDTSNSSDLNNNSSSETCSVRCNRKCTYPGDCQRYQDTNGNNHCDLGECV